jgi:hypothetical protein
MNMMVQSNLAATQFKLGEFRKAMACCDSVLEFRPTHSKAMFRKGQCYARLEDWDRAKVRIRAGIWCRSLETCPHAGTAEEGAAAQVRKQQRNFQHQRTSLIVMCLRYLQ